MANYANQVRNLLEPNLSEDWGIEKVADELNLSVRSLQMKLKDEGTKFQEIKNLLREDKVKRLLTESQDPIASIAEAVGFSDITVLSRTFKKWTGKTPSEWRQKNHS